MKKLYVVLLLCAGVARAADITIPLVVKTSNENVRPAADLFVSLYSTCKSLQLKWDGAGVGAVLEDVKPVKSQAGEAKAGETTFTDKAGPFVVGHEGHSLTILKGCAPGKFSIVAFIDSSNVELNAVPCGKGATGVVYVVGDEVADGAEVDGRPKVYGSSLLAFKSLCDSYVVDMEADSNKRLDLATSIHVNGQPKF